MIFPRSSIHPIKLDKSDDGLFFRKTEFGLLRNVRLITLVELEQGLETVFHERVRNELITKEPIGLTESCEDFVNGLRGQLTCDNAQTIPGQLTLSTFFD